MNLRNQTVLIAGLPGCGKSRIIELLVKHFTVKQQKVSFIEVEHLASLNTTNKDSTIWVIIDIRSPFVLGQDEWLETCLIYYISKAAGIIFSFVESTSLDNQAWWLKWVAIHAQGIPVVRCLNYRFPTLWDGFGSKQLPPSSFEGSVEGFCLSPMQVFTFKVGRVNLDHLLMGLDNSKQSLGMKIVRVTGKLQTIEYQNLIRLEGSALRWDTFASEADEQPCALIIKGYELDQTWLKDLIRASAL